MYCYKLNKVKTESNENAGKPDESFKSKVLICRTSSTHNFCRRLYITFPRGVARLKEITIFAKLNILILISLTKWQIVNEGNLPFLFFISSIFFFKSDYSISLLVLEYRK